MIEIRAMQMEDADAVAKLEEATFSQPWSRQGFIDSLNMGNTVFLVAEEEKRILGYVGMCFAVDEGEITNVAVEESARCRGVGSMLVDAMKAEAKQRKLERIVLEVRVSNQNAIRLYERKGFINCGVRKGFYDFPKEDAYIMIYGQ